LREDRNINQKEGFSQRTKFKAANILVHRASIEELDAHNTRLKDIHKKSEEGCMWFSLDSTE